MQLFTIGTSELNPDGSCQLDCSGNPIPTYTQSTVEAFALAYTGWTYPLAPGATQQTYNPQYWTGPMVAVDSNHDTTAKQLLVYSGASGGGMLPAGQSATQDLQGALDNVFNHPNVGPFVSRELIQHLVTSNPSPGYIERVASVFDNDGSGVRGDMKAVITAILMDPEARRGDDPATAVGTDGHLQEPILYMTGLLREFGATSDGSNLAYYGSNMGQEALFSPSVFNFYSPSYVIPGTTMYGPEFQISHHGDVSEPGELGKQFCVRLAGIRNDGGFFELCDSSSKSDRIAWFAQYFDASRLDVVGHAERDPHGDASGAGRKQSGLAASAGGDLSDWDFVAISSAALDAKRRRRGSVNMARGKGISRRDLLRASCCTAASFGMTAALGRLNMIHALAAAARQRVPSAGVHFSFRRQR